MFLVTSNVLLYERHLVYLFCCCISSSLLCSVYWLLTTEPLGSIPRDCNDFMRDLWWTSWHWTHFLTEFLQVPFQVTIPSILHTYLSLPPEVCDSPIHIARDDILSLLSCDDILSLLSCDVIYAPVLGCVQNRELIVMELGWKMN
jgi:hypothetical protein